MADVCEFDFLDYRWRRLGLCGYQLHDEALKRGCAFYSGGLRFSRPNSPSNQPLAVFDSRGSVSSQSIHRKARRPPPGGSVNTIGVLQSGQFQIALCPMPRSCSSGTGMSNKVQGGAPAKGDAVENVRGPLTKSLIGKGQHKKLRRRARKIVSRRRLLLSPLILSVKSVVGPGQSRCELAHNWTHSFKKQRPMNRKGAGLRSRPEQLLRRQTIAASNFTDRIAVRCDLRDNPNLLFMKPGAPAARAREYFNPLRGPAASIVTCDHSNLAAQTSPKLSDLHLFRKVMSAHRLR